MQHSCLYKSNGYRKIVCGTVCALIEHVHFPIRLEREADFSGTAKEGCRSGRTSV